MFRKELYFFIIYPYIYCLPISQDYEYPNHPQNAQHQKNDRCPPPPQMLPERACEVPGCRSDSECERHKRCCYNGCIYACLESVQPPPGEKTHHDLLRNQYKQQTHISALASLQGMVLMDFKMNWSSREVWVTQLDAYSELWVHLAILILCIDFLLLSAGLVGAAQAAVVRRERLAFRWTRRSSAGWVSINQWLNTDSPLNVVWSNNKNS